VYSERRKENVQCGTYPSCYFTFGRKNILTQVGTYEHFTM